MIKENTAAIIINTARLFPVFSGRRPVVADEQASLQRFEIAILIQNSKTRSMQIKAEYTAQRSEALTPDTVDIVFNEGGLRDGIDAINKNGITFKV